VEGLRVEVGNDVEEELIGEVVERHCVVRGRVEGVFVWVKWICEEERV
jgi:hypothetical protein